MTSPAELPQSLFIVRISEQAAPAGPGRWYGSVEHVASGLRMCFLSLQDLNDFIAVRLNLANAQARLEPTLPFPQPEQAALTEALDEHED